MTEWFDEKCKVDESFCGWLEENPDYLVF
jgi:hypothetical protein